MSRALADAMRAAADTLEAVSGLYGAQHYPAEYPWSATELRREAEHVETEPNL
jgi:hypothetical protein